MDGWVDIFFLFCFFPPVKLVLQRILFQLVAKEATILLFIILLYHLLSPLRGNLFYSGGEQAHIKQTNIKDHNTLNINKYKNLQ